MKAYLNERGFRILDALEAVAASHKAKPAEVALAWVMARPGVTAPIASATSVGAGREPDPRDRADALARRHDGAERSERVLNRRRRLGSELPGDTAGRSSGRETGRRPSCPAL